MLALMEHPSIVVDEGPLEIPSRRCVEIVERKGRGHPDSICDAVAEAVALGLVRAYRQTFGFIPHFNADKALLVAGRAEHRFGGGRIVEPAELVIGDRATDEISGKRLDVAAIAEAAAKEWIAVNLPHADAGRDFAYGVELKPGAPQLARMMTERGRTPVANDTSATVGFAPLSSTERLVLDVERYLNGRPFKTKFPMTGEDVKVMAVRRDRSVSLTIAMPLIDRYIPSESAYFECKAAVEKDLRAYAAERGGDVDASVAVNTLDERGAGVGGVYLSIIGTSAEDGDSGEVGRGNSVNGLISLMRPGGAEAAAGKNPTCHVGKIYNVLAHRMASVIHREVEGVEHVAVWLCSQIGSPVDRPHLCAARLHPAEGHAVADLVSPVRERLERELANVGQLCEELARGEHAVC